MSKLEAFLLNWSEYVHRLKRGFKYAAFFFVLVAFVAILAAVAIGALSTEDDYLNAMKSTSTTAVGVAAPVSIDGQGVHASAGEKDVVLPDDGKTIDADAQRSADSEKDVGTESHFDVWVFTICILEAFLVVVLGFGFSGAFAAVFLSPINPLKFAPYGLLDEQRCCLAFRIWICYPSEKYLHNVKVSVGYAYRNMYSASTFLFESMSEDPRQMGTLQVQEQMRPRGVWDVEIPLEGEVAAGLLRVFGEYANRNPVIKISVQGTTDSGEIVEREVRFNRQHILPGYIFASYHFPYENDPEREALYSQYKTRDIWFGNFPKVIPLEAAIEGRHSGAVNCGRDEEGPQMPAHRARTSYEEWKSILQGEPGCSLLGIEEEQTSLLAPFITEPTNEWRPRLTFAEWRQINKLP